MSCCASCGVKESDDVKLKKCAACHLVRYCSIACQKEHRPKHKRACKQRAAELHDEVLFRQPEGSNLGDCPICYLPLPIVEDNFDAPTIMPCCGKIICMGCDLANQKREFEQKLVPKCSFCRTPAPKSDTEGIKRLKDKADKMNDPIAMSQLGTMRYQEGDYQIGFGYLSKAANLGDAAAHLQLARMYHEGHGVEKDESKGVHHFEQAAIGGHPKARHNLGVFEWTNGRRERAVKHWIIAAKLGNDPSLENLKEAYKGGLLRKDDFATALRAHQAAVDATKSPQRDEAAAVAKLA